MALFVGLDCGGSSTRLLAVDEAGAILATAQAGGANLCSTPEPKIIRNLAIAAEGCPAPDAVCGCFAGLISSDDRLRALDYLRNLFPSAKLRAEPDFAAAFAACDPGTDVCVISGTGSLVCSRHGGVMRKSGGRGYILGDEGSAYRLGREALLRYLNAPDTASSDLKKLVERYFGGLEESTVVARLYQTSTPQAIVAKLAKAVGSDAKAGEDYAVQAMDRHLSSLAEVVARHIQLHFAGRRELRVSLAGGLWQITPLFRDTFEAALKVAAPQVDTAVHRITRAPVAGATDLAKELVHGN